MSDFLFNEEAHPNAAIANRILKDYRRDHPKRITHHVNPTPLLCRAAVRTFLLDLAKQERQFHKFTRVSEETLLALRARCDRSW